MTNDEALGDTVDGARQHVRVRMRPGWRRTRSMVRRFNSSGSFHGNTVISALGASEATSTDVCSGCAGTSSGSTSIGVRQFRIKSRDTLYRKSG